MQLVDIGANLGHESFRHDLPALLERAALHGVRRMIVTGASRDGSTEAVMAGALFFHAAYAGPFRGRVRVGRIAGHIFYR